MSDSTTNSQSQSSEDQPRVSGFEALKRHIIAHKIDVTLWTTRVLTLMFAFSYFIPLFGNPYNAYYKVLVANAATSALRLHQRLPGLQFTGQYLAQLVQEDSSHYLFYSLIFLFVTPVTLVLVPVVLFAFLHASSYLLTLCDVFGPNSFWGARLLVSLVEFQSRTILRAISFVEIMLMPLTVILVVMGRAALLTPFIYYNFIVKRYTSRRNPNTRNMFHELRLLVERIAAKPKLPIILRRALLALVAFTNRLAPIQPVASAQ